jgi:hypothetical protein
MPPQSLTQSERDVLIVLATLEQVSGSMLNKQTFGKKWCGASAGRQAADLERAIQGLINKGLLRENASKTTIGFTSAGYAQSST